ncbi:MULTISPECIES: DMT family transporter [Haemophilus]|nr:MULTISPECIES: DMT family transporter [Haemophilus]EGT75853.1 putative drug/metabolite transporter [Haemophilus haemolyticus M19501]PRJ57527.1 putative DMT superfamily transporter inner membrane protein [Haemophilus influenzae]PRJ59098.1 putative DMT superfamily transporter inner membrane protein [Haemophilus influenzae]
MIYQILALLIWSSSLIVGKLTYSMMDPVLVVQVRLIIAMILVMPLFLRRWKKIDKPMRKQLWWLAFFNYTAVFLLQFIGLKYTSASSAVTMIGLEPLLVIFVGHFFFKDKAKWFHWLFGAMAFIGVAILINGGKNNEGIDNVSLLGCLLVLSAGIIFATVLRWTRRVVAKVSTQVYTAISIVLGAITTLPFTLLLTENWQISLNSTGIVGLLYLALGCSWLAYWLWHKGLNTVDANISGILLALEPLFGILFAVSLLGETLSFSAVLGITIIMLATLGSTLLPKLLKKSV